MVTHYFYRNIHKILGIENIAKQERPRDAPCVVENYTKLFSVTQDHSKLRR